MTNFDFLQKLDSDLFEIAKEAEKLFRDEYFEQCITQTRRFGEVVCKKMLKDKASLDDTFDNMLASLKDKSSSSAAEKEFLDDLYFLKQAGNEAVHSTKVKQDGIKALECVNRTFEAAISYAVYKKGADSKLLKQRFDRELLVTGKKSRKSLEEKFIEKKKDFEKKEKKIKTKKTLPQKLSVKRKGESKKKYPVYEILFLAVIAGVILSVLYFVLKQH